MPAGKATVTPVDPSTQDAAVVTVVTVTNLVAVAASNHVMTAVVTKAVMAAVAKTVSRAALITTALKTEVTVIHHHVK